MTKENGKQSISDEKLLRQREVLERRRRKGGGNRRSQRLSTNPDNRPQSPCRLYIYVCVCVLGCAFSSFSCSKTKILDAFYILKFCAVFPAAGRSPPACLKALQSLRVNGRNYSARAVAGRGEVGPGTPRREI